MRYKKLYGAYGANTNMENMEVRCPDARFLGRGVVEGMRLQFRGVADIETAPRGRIEVAVWAITDECEEALDHFEGYPFLYSKQSIETECLALPGTWFGDNFPESMPVQVMYYSMNDKQTVAPPPKAYYECLHRGYRDCDLPMAQLFSADGRAWRTRKGKRRKSRWG